MNPYLPESEPNFWLSCVALDADSGVRPADVLRALEAQNMEGRPLWKPMHLQPVYAGREFVSLSGGDVGGDLFARGLCLPSDIKMTAQEQDRVIAVVRSCFEKS
jgi:dTDP-4-amino-4,6-dideoxygalactose transaminase